MGDGPDAKLNRVVHLLAIDPLQERSPELDVGHDGRIRVDVLRVERDDPAQPVGQHDVQIRGRVA